MFWKLFLFITCIKIILIPAYYSTDFEVHRNWLALTHNLPLSEWYYESTSEWTLDYPPFFAYFEWFLSQFAKYVDSEMLVINNLNYNSTRTVLFQRISVISSDFVYALGVKYCLGAFVKVLPMFQKSQFSIGAGILLFNVGLLFVDHIHFQYNGFLFGILLLSIGCLLKSHFLFSALLFASLLNFKHIFLYIAPPFGVYLLRFYCLESSKPVLNFIKLAMVTLTCFLVSFGPFLHHLPQIFSRLFPFKRGLTHAYWAPNMWAMYNFGDKILSSLLNARNASGKGTGGLVEEYEHAFFPKINPFVTFVLTAIFMIPSLYKLAFVTTDIKKYEDFIRSIVICSCTSFMYGWHVHEKAILMVILPLSLLMIININDAKWGFFLIAIAHFSLHPLLFENNLMLIKYSLILTYQFALIDAIKHIFPHFTITRLEKTYYVGLLMLVIYQEIVQFLLFSLNKKLPFLPLLLISVYCSIGVTYFYINYYLYFLINKTLGFSLGNSKKKCVSNNKKSRFNKKLD